MSIIFVMDRRMYVTVKIGNYQVNYLALLAVFPSMTHIEIQFGTNIEKLYHNFTLYELKRNFVK